MIEIKNIKVVRREGTQDEYVHYYHRIDVLESFIVDVNPVHINDAYFCVQVGLENGQVHITCATAEKAIACYETFKAIMVAKHGDLHTIDLNDYQN